MPPRGRRPVGGPDAREVILTAAGELFAELGFERTTMRAVATRADVDAALIHHYFVNKEGLLAAALVLPVDPAALLAGLDEDPEHAGEAVVRRVLGFWEADPETRRRLLGLIRVGLSHEYAASVLRDLLGRTILTALARVVADDHRPLRAALVGTQMGGLLLGRYVLGIPAVRDATPEQLVVAIGPVVQHYLVGPVGGAED
ncbi:MAG TPA: TetR family transcriptional regulator [Dermatophilaceae bacterium]|jgi:AcrR family transcriptional regulator|nr:TetR family transcriptional regulator [Dermatophilaceae bacterium]